MSRIMPSVAFAVILPIARSLMSASGGEPAGAGWIWVNQSDGPRPQYVWENREDVIYHDLAYANKAVESAPEFGPFMGRAWVFNRAMEWYREPEGILCYSAPATLVLTGMDAVSAWHSDVANEIAQDGEWTVFGKASTNRRRDCAVLPAFQFHLGQNPDCELEVAEATDAWQFVVSVKGRGGPPLLASDWMSGPATVRFDVAGALRAKGFDLDYAELHFVIGTWAKSAEAPASLRFRLRMPGRPALVACLPIVRAAGRVREAGAPLLAAALDAQGRRLDRDRVRVRADVGGRAIELEERDGLWRAAARDLGVGDHVVRLTAEGAIKASASMHVRITDGQFWGLDRERGRFTLARRVHGPLSGSYQGNVFVSNPGSAGEALVQGQQAWNDWDRTGGAREHLLYWEGLTAKEMDARFGYLSTCGWDLLHVCQHWGIWERLDAGGRIAPHGAEQIALYLRTAGRHGLAVIQALTHYEYLKDFREWHGTVPFTAYLDAGFENEDFFEPGRNPRFDELFRRYLLDYVTLFREETALFAMTASGEGDATIGQARAHDVFDFVRAHDPNHLFLGEPTHILRESPRRYTQGWRQDLFGGRTYAIGQHFAPEYDLGVEMKLYRLGGLAMAEGSWATSGLYARFHLDVLEDQSWAAGSWTGTERYRLRLRDSLYLGLVHRLPMMMTWDEQIAEDEHRLVREIRQEIDWAQPFEVPPVAIRLASDDLETEHRRTLVQYEEALNRMRLSYQLLYPDTPQPDGVEVVLDAAMPFAAPAYAREGGALPDSLMSRIPLMASAGYAVSYSVSRDRATLLAYLCNNRDQYELASPLAGRLHRRPQAAPLGIRIENLAAQHLRLRLYDLTLRMLVHNEVPLGDSRSIELGSTDADYFVLVTPARRSMEALQGIPGGPHQP